MALTILAMRKLLEKAILMIFLAVPPSAVPFQGGQRPASPSPPANTTPSTPTRRRVPVTRRRGPRDTDVAKLANIVLKVTPSDSTVWLNDQKVGGLGPDGSIPLANLKPGPYVIAIRHSGYADEVQSIELKAGTNEPIAIALEPLKGTLVVRPNVDGTAIEVRSIDRNQHVGSYIGIIDGIDFPPGDYELTVSKPGYKPKTRTVSLSSSALVELELTLEAVPSPTPTPRVVIPTQSSVNVDGKFLVVRVAGRSGDTGRTTGTMEITINKASPTAYVQGSFTGVPCEITFQPLENIDNWVLTDFPSVSNGWALVGARVRLRDSKRPARFVVNWVAKQSTFNSSGEPQQTEEKSRDVTIKATPIHRVVPNIPPMAKASGIKGLVKVTVVIDEEGNVKSAKAFDGPAVLRHAAENAAYDWRFKPATRNGIPIPSTETIYFTFEGY